MTDPIDRLAAALPPAAPPLSAALETELAQLAPVAPRLPHRQLAILAAVSIVYAAGMVAMLSVRRDLRELPVGWLAAVAVLWWFERTNARIEQS